MRERERFIETLLSLCFFLSVHYHCDDDDDDDDVFSPVSWFQSVVNQC